MSKRHHILFARTDVASHPVLATSVDIPDAPLVEHGDLQDWMTDEWHGRLEDLDPGFYVWEGYFLHEGPGEYHVETMAVRPATTDDFRELGFPAPMPVQYLDQRPRGGAA